MIRFAVILLGVLVLFMAAGGIPAADGSQTVVFRTPVFVILLALLGLLLVLGCVRYGRGLERVVFWPAHLGVVLILAGAGLGLALGRRGRLLLPVESRHGVSRLPAKERAVETPLGFDLSVVTFDVEYYDPTYVLCRPTTDDPRDADDYTPAAELAPADDGTVWIDDYGRVPRDALREPSSGAWVPQVRLTNGWILQRSEQTPRKFLAELAIERDAVRSTRTVEVNKPATVNGWRIYLMSYHTQVRPSVQLLLRRDPGRGLVIAGLWCVIVGTALLCWRGRPAPDKKEDRS
jgi:hypothetical protein